MDTKNTITNVGLKKSIDEQRHLMIQVRGKYNTEAKEVKAESALQKAVWWNNRMRSIT